MEATENIVVGPEEKEETPDPRADQSEEYQERVEEGITGVMDPDEEEG